MATYYVSDATGNDVDDGLSEGNAWATVDKAMNTVAAGDIVYVKADGDYTESAFIDTAGSSSATITFEGYTSTPGDGGQATVDGESTRTLCIADTITGSLHYVFKNFIFKRATVNNANMDGSDLIFKNCAFLNSTGDGYAGGDRTFFENCLFGSNGGAGIDGSGQTFVIGCRFDNNTGEGAEISAGAFIFDCTFFGNGADAIECLGGNGTFVFVLRCTIDGDGKTTNTGIDLGSSFWKRTMVINNIVYDCVEGVDCASQGTFFVSRNNLLNNNTTAYPGSRFQTFEGEVVSTPQFEDEAGGDYSLGSASPAKNAGFDGYLQNGSTQRADIGAIESTVAGGGGGLLMPNKRAGKQ
jgi:hypothetical protein